MTKNTINMKNLFVFLLITIFFSSNTAAQQKRLKLYNPEVPLASDEIVLMGRILVHKTNYSTNSQYLTFDDAVLSLKDGEKTGATTSDYVLRIPSYLGKGGTKIENYNNIIVDDSYFFYVVPYNDYIINGFGIDKICDGKGYCTWRYFCKKRRKDTDYILDTKPGNYYYLGTFNIIIDEQPKSATFNCNVEFINDYTLFMQKFKAVFSDKLQMNPEIIKAYYLPEEERSVQGTDTYLKWKRKYSSSFVARPLTSSTGEIYFSTLDTIFSINNDGSVNWERPLTLKDYYYDWGLNKFICSPEGLYNRILPYTHIAVSSDGNKIFYKSGSNKISCINNKNEIINSIELDNKIIPKTFAYNMNNFFVSTRNNNYVFTDNLEMIRNTTKKNTSFISDDKYYVCYNETCSSYDIYSDSLTDETKIVTDSLKILKKTVNHIVISSGPEICYNPFLESISKINIDGKLYYRVAIDQNKNIFYFNLTNRINMWKLSPNENTYRKIVVDNSGNMYFIDQMYLICIDNMGQFKWKYYFDTVLLTPPVAGIDNIIYVGTGDGYLYAFENIVE